MKIKKYLCLIIGLITFFTSCSKDKQTLTDNTWKVESMKVHADSALSFPSEWGHIVLSFPKIGKYHLIFEGNISEGNTSIIGDKIKLKEKMATLVLNSQFASSCHLLLCNTNKYEISNDHLIIKGDNGEIINFIKE